MKLTSSSCGLGLDRHFVVPDGAVWATSYLQRRTFVLRDHNVRHWHSGHHSRPTIWCRVGRELSYASLEWGLRPVHRPHHIRDPLRVFCNSRPIEDDRRGHAFQAVLGIVMTVAIPYMINPDEANLQGKLGYYFGGLGALCLVWSYFRVPETKGRTFEELDVLFDRKVPARQFKNYQIEESSPAETQASM